MQARAGFVVHSFSHLRSPQGSQLRRYAVADRCTSTLICAQRDQLVFEELGYRLDSAESLTIDGEEISGAIIMIDEQAASGHYDELTALKGVPFMVSNTARRGAFDDHLLVSDGQDWAYAEVLCDSHYPAVRVSRGGSIAPGDLADARTYWRVYARPLKTIEERGRHSSALRRTAQ
jgi:hypothetical protein